MRFSLLLLSAVFILSITAHSQEKEIKNHIVETDSIRKGIYLSFREFKRNSPSNTNEFHFLKTSDKQVARGALPNFLYQVDSMGKRDTITHGIWGFSTGKDIYKLEEGDTIVPSYYTKIISVGRYCYYEDHLIYSIDAGGLLTGSPTIKRQKQIPYIININNGRIFRLEDKLMRSILEDDPELLAEYKAEKNRKENYGRYIKMYSDRHPEQMK